MHSEVKQTETLKFGAEKVYGKAMEGDGWLMAYKAPDLPEAKHF